MSIFTIFWYIFTVTRAFIKRVRDKCILICLPTGMDFFHFVQQHIL